MYIGMAIYRFRVAQAVMSFAIGAGDDRDNMRYCTVGSALQIANTQQPLVPPSEPCLDLWLYMLSVCTPDKSHLTMSAPALTSLPG